VTAVDCFLGGAKVVNCSVNAPVSCVSVISRICELSCFPVHVSFHIKPFLQIPHDIVDILLKVGPSVVGFVSSVVSKATREETYVESRSSRSRAEGGIVVRGVVVVGAMAELMLSSSE
jgi:hypothetical protein